MSTNYQTKLTQLLGIQYPVIMAPMFLVSNVAMVKAAMQSGITGAIPALNYRTIEEFEAALTELKKEQKPFGINLIVNKSNIKMQEQLDACVKHKVDFIITSLGSPQKVIEACKPYGIKVFCDVVDAEYAAKVVKLGADALIAVNNEAGGHAGNLSPEKLIPMLVSDFDIPVISAGGVGDAKSLKRILDLGACGVSVGSPFIASHEAGVSEEYKQACVDYTDKDIVFTTKLSGTPCTVINTPYVKEIGTQQNWLERLLNKNKRLKKLIKMLTFYKGMKALEKAAFSSTYKTVWCAGPTIKYTTKITSVAEVVKRLVG
jgi:nitronate monooxygenase